MACVYVLIRESEPETPRYVGISKFDDPKKRFYSHSVRSKTGYSLPVYDWMRKHEDVTYKLIKSKISVEEAKTLEVKLIKKFRKNNVKLLNCTDGGDGADGLSEEAREKIRKSSLGRRHTVETKKKMSEAKLGKSTWNKGIPMREESKAKLSNSKKNKTLSAEHKQKISNSNRGRVVSEETKRKIGDAHRNKVVSEETRAKLSIANKGKIPPNKGKPMSEEQKIKLSNSRKGIIPWNKGLKIGG
jgi:hypothetical protein